MPKRIHWSWYLNHLQHQRVRQKHIKIEVGSIQKKWSRQQKWAIILQEGKMIRQIWGGIGWHLKMLQIGFQNSFTRFFDQAMSIVSIQVMLVHFVWYTAWFSPDVSIRAKWLTDITVHVNPKKYNSRWLYQKGCNDWIMPTALQ